MIKNPKNYRASGYHENFEGNVQRTRTLWLVMRSPMVAFHRSFLCATAIDFHETFHGTMFDYGLYLYMMPYQYDFSRY